MNAFIRRCVHKVLNPRTKSRYRNQAEEENAEVRLECNKNKKYRQEIAFLCVFHIKRPKKKEREN